MKENEQLEPSCAHWCARRFAEHPLSGGLRQVTSTGAKVSILRTMHRHSEQECLQRQDVHMSCKQVLTLLCSDHLGEVEWWPITYDVGGDMGWDIGWGCLGVCGLVDV